MNNNNSSKNSILLVTGLIALLWITAVLLFFDFDHEIGWINFGFGVLGFIVLALVEYFYDSNISRRIAPEQYGPIIIISRIFVVVSCAFNSICIFAKVENIAIIVLVNVAVLVFYGIMIIATRKSVADVSYYTETIANSIDVNRNIKADVQALVMLNKDEKLAPALKQLKELVEYSDRMGRAGAMAYEDSFSMQINNIRQAMIQNVSADVILPQINEAVFTWNQRNANM